MTKRIKNRANGQGTIRLLPSGRWQAKIWTDGGYIPAPHTFDAKIDADAWLKRQAKDLALGTFVAPERAAPKKADTADSFQAYAERWIAERRLKPRTRQEYEGLLKRHLAPLGEYRLKAITPAIVRTWHSACCPSHPATRVKAYSLLKAIFTTAVEDELIPANPCRIRGAGTPVKAASNPIPTPAQVADLVAAMPEELRPTVILAAWGGLRLGEVLGIRGEDLRGGAVHVRQSAVAVRGGMTTGTPKSDAGSRTVILPAGAAQLLAGLEDRRGLLFPRTTDKGRPLATVTFYKHWDAARKAAGMPDLKFHTLRHFHGTTAAQSGATTMEVMARMGHTSPTMALRYQRAIRDQEVADRLSAAMG